MPKTVSNTPSVYSFLRIADDASIPDNARVTMDGNNPKAVSHITFQSTNQRAMQTFLRSIAYEFGQGVADIATRELRNAITTSSPLTAGNVRNVKSLLERNIHKQLSLDCFLHGINTATGRFDSGSGFPAEFERHCATLEQALGAPIPAPLKGELCNEVLRDFFSCYQKLEIRDCTPEKMASDLVERTVLKKLLACASSGLLGLPGSVEDKIAVVRECYGQGRLLEPGLVLHRLPSIRSRFQEGPLSLETIWQGCFGRPMPEGLKPWDGTLEAAFSREIVQALGLQERPDTLGLAGSLTGCMAPDKIIGMFDGTLSHLGLTDFLNLPRVSFEPYPSLSGLEAFRKDAAREFVSVPFPAHVGRTSCKIEPSVQVGTNEPVRTGMRVGKSDIGKHVDSIAGQVLAECAGNTQQADAVLHLCSQSVMRQFFGLNGIGMFVGSNGAQCRTFIGGEHCVTRRNIQRLSNGDVQVNIRTPDDDPQILEHVGRFSVTVTVDRNGQCRYTDMELALAAPAPASA